LEWRNVIPSKLKTGWLLSVVLAEKIYSNISIYMYRIWDRMILEFEF
jgi:hypothetical protein